MRQTDTYGTTETFFTRHVRLITFLVCIAVFLVFFGPVSVFTVKGILDRRADTRREMTVEDVIALADKPRRTLGDLTVFEGQKSEKTVPVRDGSGGTSERNAGTYYYVTVESRYLLSGVTKPDSDELVYLTLSDYRSGESVDLLTGDVRAFFDRVRNQNE